MLKRRQATTAAAIQCFQQKTEGSVDLTEYKSTLIDRFANPAIRDQLSRIGISGSSGMPKFVPPSIRDPLSRGGPIDLLTFTIACWFRYLNGNDELGREIAMQDPMTPRLREIARVAAKDPTPLLAMREIFDEKLASDPRFVTGIRTMLASFYQTGARTTLRKSVGFPV